MENEGNKEQVWWKLPCHSVALEVKANLMTFSAFSFKNKTHFSDMKCAHYLSMVFWVVFRQANICHKINFKLPTPSFFKGWHKSNLFGKLVLHDSFLLLQENSLTSVMCVCMPVYCASWIYDEPFFSFQHLWNQGVCQSLIGSIFFLSWWLTK